MEIKFLLNILNYMELSHTPETLPHRVSWLWGCLVQSGCACLTLKSGSWIWSYLLPLTQRSHPGMGCCLFVLPSKEKDDSLEVSISKVTSLFRYEMLQQKTWNKIFFLNTRIFFGIIEVMLLNPKFSLARHLSNIKVS